MFSRANPKIEYKEEAKRCYSVKFQGKYFRPCVGLMHWVRWGEFVLDIRPLRQYLKLPEEVEELYLNDNKATFEKRIKQITDAVGERSFFSLNARVNEMIEIKQKREKIEAQKSNIPYDDDLPL